MRAVTKRLCSALLLLALCVSLFACVTPAASAAELKTAIGTVNAGSLRLREEPSTDSDILGTARRGDMVVVIRTDPWRVFHRDVRALLLAHRPEGMLEADAVPARRRT